VIAGEKELKPRSCKVAANETMLAYAQSKVESMMDMKDKELQKHIYSVHARVLKETVKIQEDEKYKNRLADDICIEFSELMALSAVRKDIVARVTKQQRAGGDVDEILEMVDNDKNPVVADEWKPTLRKAIKILDDFNGMRKVLVDALSAILKSCCEISVGSVAKQFLAVSAISKACDPPVEVSYNTVSKGQMVCDFTGNIIPEGVTPHSIKFKYFDDTDSEVSRSFRVSTLGRSMLFSLYRFWNWPRCLVKRLVDEYQAFGGRRLSDVEAVKKVTAVATMGIATAPSIGAPIGESASLATWNEFEVGRKVCMALMSACIAATRNALKELKSDHKHAKEEEPPRKRHKSDKNDTAVTGANLDEIAEGSKDELALMAVAQEPPKKHKKTKAPEKKEDPPVDVEEEKKDELADIEEKKDPVDQQQSTSEKHE
jgi:hypothetical protein